MGTYHEIKERAPSSFNPFRNFLCDKWHNFCSIGVSPDVERICKELGMVREPLREEFMELQ